MADHAGTAGNDVLTSDGSSVLTGYNGNDTYYSKSITDTIVEQATVGSGIDSIFLDENFNFGIATAYTLAANVERLGLSALDLSGSATFDDTNKLLILGNALSNVISIGEHGNEIRVYADAGNDTINGGSGNDEIDGGAGADLINGNAGSDILFGGSDRGSIDTLSGGAGADTYVLRDTTDKIIEVNDASINTIKLTSDFTEAKLDLTDRKKFINSYISVIDASASPALAKGLTLTGNATTSTNIIGSAGKDIITGGTAADRFEGGGGDDTYNIAGANDTIVEVGGLSGGNDTVAISKGIGAITLTLANNVENINASSMVANANLSGNGQANSITGGSGKDTLYGGDDALTDVLTGGEGSDTYIIQDSKDTITELGKGTGNIDTIKLTDDYDDDTVTAGTAAYTLNNTYIEVLDGSLSNLDLTLTGNAKTATKIIGGSGDDALYGGIGNDTLIGGVGNDILTGGTGNDTYIIDDLASDTIIENAVASSDTIKLSSSWAVKSVGLDVPAFANIENIDGSDSLVSLILTGNNSNNVLTGSKGSDILYAGVGKDTLIGGKGSDLYFLANADDKVTENKDEGYDKIILNDTFNAAKYTLAANVEFLDATAAARGMTITNDTKNATTTPMTILGTMFNDNITGSTGDDTIMSYSGNDTIYGGAGNDYLDGGDGADYLSGGAGDDLFYSGTDSYADTFDGGEGVDCYWLSDTNDVIKDTSLGNTIRLTSFFDENKFSLANNVGDYNYSAANINYLDAHFVTSHGLELTASNVVKTIKTVIPASGTTKAKTVITYEGVDTMIEGTSYSDTIIGYMGDDTLYGGRGNSTLYGFGDDVLYGGGGNNILLGGVEDDTYILDGTATSTTITELADTEKQEYGIDTVKLITNNGAFTTGIDYELLYTPGKYNGLESASISLVDYANVEILDASLIAETKLTLTANDLGNTIIGGSADDSIVGGAKNDSLLGGDGNDTIYGGQGVNTLCGGAGDDTYKISIVDEESIVVGEGAGAVSNAWSWTEADGETIPVMLTEFSDTDGIDTIILEGKTSYNQEHYEHFALALAPGIDNLDASAISKDLGLIILGNSLDNIITGGTGFDNISTGDGDDTVYDYKKYVLDGTTYWTGNTINVGNGNNTVVTGWGDDDITAGTGDDFIYDYDGDNTVSAGDGNNRIYTGAGIDDITTGVGNDYIVSGDGGDTIHTGWGNDTIDSGLDDDIIYAGAGNDYVIGGGGDDTLRGGAGNDTLDAGAGANEFYVSVGSGKDLILSTNANDIISLDSALIDTADMLFYTDNQNNFYIDYTVGGTSVGTDVLEIAADCYDDNTTIQIGASTIHINTIIGQLTAATSGLDGAAITALDASVEATQVANLTWT